MSFTTFENLFYKSYQDDTVLPNTLARDISFHNHKLDDRTVEYIYQTETDLMDGIFNLASYTFVGQYLRIKYVTGVK